MEFFGRAHVCVPALTPMPAPDALGGIPSFFAGSPIDLLSDGGAPPQAGFTPKAPWSLERVSANLRLGPRDITSAPEMNAVHMTDCAPAPFAGIR